MTQQQRKEALLHTALVLALLPTLPCWGQTSAQPLVTVDNGASVQLSSSCCPSEIRLAVSPKPGFLVKRSAKAQENPEVVEVAFGNLRDGSLVGSFVPRWELAPSGAPVALVVQVDAKVKKAGNYDVILNLQPRSIPLAPRLKIQIVHPAAKLELPDKLLVNRTVYWPFGANPDKMALNVREASGLSQMTDLTIQPKASMSGTEMVTGQLSIAGFGSKSSSRPTLGAGQVQNFDYDLAGDFPLGTVSGSIRFFSPELLDPATLNFEVHSKLTKAYIFVAIVLGLLLSWLLKVHLHNQIELADARSKAVTLLDRVQDDFSTHHDGAFRGSLESPMKELRKAIANQDASAIAERVADLDQAWRGALQSYAVRLQEAHAALDELRTLTESIWNVPARALDILANAKQTAGGEVDISHIQQELAKNDPSMAIEAGTRLRRKLAGELRELGNEWQTSLKLYLASLASAPAGLPAPVVVQFSTALSKNEQNLGRMKPEQLAADPPTAVLIQFLRDFEAEHWTATELLKELRLRLEQEWTAFISTLNLLRDEVLEDQRLQALREHLDTFVREVEESASAPGAEIDMLQDRLADLQRAWEGAIQPQLDSIATGNRAEIVSLVKGRDFVRAAERIAEERAAPQKNHMLTETGEEEQPEKVREEPQQWPDLHGVWPASSLTILSSSPQIVRVPDAVVGLHFRSIKKVFSAKAVQTLVVGGLLVVWAYNSYSQNYGGTWSDLTTIFFGAFGLDLGLDALVTKVRVKEG